MKIILSHYVTNYNIFIDKKHCRGELCSPYALKKILILYTKFPKMLQKCNRKDTKITLTKTGIENKINVKAII